MSLGPQGMSAQPAPDATAATDDLTLTRDLTQPEPVPAAGIARRRSVP